MNGKENNYCHARESHCPVKSGQAESGQTGKRRPSIFAELARVKEQVEFDCFGVWVQKADGGFVTNRNGNKVVRIDPMYEELCLIIAEVNLLHPDSAIKVAGLEISAFIVQEVYSKLTNEHLETVLHNFQRVSWRINHKKTYLRTALYNSVFELESGAANQVAQYMPCIRERRGGKA
jgi:hypothetical protein